MVAFSCITSYEDSETAPGAATAGSEQAAPAEPEEQVYHSPVPAAPAAPVEERWEEGESAEYMAAEESYAAYSPSYEEAEAKAAPRPKRRASAKKRKRSSKKKSSRSDDPLAGLLGGGSPKPKRAGGGTGEGTIGLGNIGTIGHGAGTGTGQGFGSGQGRLSGDGAEEVTIDQSDEVELEPKVESPLSLVDKLLKRLDLGNLAFNTPAAMKLGDTAEVALLLSVKEEVEVLKATLAAKSGDPVETAEGVRVAPEMEASLVGPGFSIEAVTPVKQAVSTLQPTRWAWSVTPTKDGTQKLHLTLSARIKVEGKDTPYVVQTFSREIEVKVELTDVALGLLKEHGEWLWTGVLVPVGLWLWNRRKKKKAAASEPPSQDS